MKRMEMGSSKGMRLGWVRSSGVNRPNQDREKRLQFPPPLTMPILPPPEAPSAPETPHETLLGLLFAGINPHLPHQSARGNQNITICPSPTVPQHHQLKKPSTMTRKTKLQRK